MPRWTRSGILYSKAVAFIAGHSIGDSDLNKLLHTSPEQLCLCSSNERSRHYGSSRVCFWITGNPSARLDSDCDPRISNRASSSRTTPQKHHPERVLDGAGIEKIRVSHIC